MTGTLRAIRDGADQAFAAARHAQINVLRERKQNRNRLAVGRGHDLDRVFGKMRERFFARVNHGLRDDLVGVQRFLAAAQNRRVAGFETQARRVRRHVRARFVNDDDDANGRGNFLQFQSVWPDAFVENFSDRIGQRRDFAQTFGHRGNSFVVELEPVEHRGGQIQFRAEFHVERVGFLDCGGIFFQRIGHREQAGIFLRRGQLGEFARRGLGLFGQLRHLFGQIHGC